MLEIGSIVEGKVSGLTSFGAFVSLPDGKSGMVHISEVSTAFVKEIGDVLQVGQDVTAAKTARQTRTERLAGPTEAEQRQPFLRRYDGALQTGQR